MSNYRREMMELVQELRTRMKPLHRDKRQRQAEVLEFIILHPEGLAELFKSQEEAENAK